MFKRVLPTVAILLLAVCAHSFQGGMKKMYHMFGDPYPRVVLQAFAYMDKQYVDPSRVDPEKILKGAFKGLETRFPPVIIDTDAKAGVAVVRVADKQKEVPLGSPVNATEAAKPLNEVASFVADELKGKEERSDVFYAALNGAAAELDPHSNAIDPKQFKEFMVNTRGSFGGIGFVFGIRDGSMLIITPIEDTPAHRGGLKSGDRIILIDGEPTINMPTDVAASKMRGDPDTEVTLTIAREGWSEPRPFTFVREIIHVVSVQKYLLEEESQAPVLMVKIKNFQKDTAEQLRNAITEAERENPELAGVIIDLRNNPGGLLDQAIELSDGFMQEGTIVSTKGRGGEALERSLAVDDEPYTEKPLVILINQGSASASEIVSGALRAERALLIGTKTYGKGSVQKLFRLPDTGALKLTVAQYLTANDVSIQSIGIQPDILTYAAAVKPGRVRIGPPPTHNSEADLENAFTDWGNASEESWAEVQYFAPADEPSGHGADAMQAREEDIEPRKSFDELTMDEKLERLSEDFPVKLARLVLANIPEGGRKSAHRKELFTAAEKAIDEVREAEQQKLGASLDDHKVDWSKGETSLDDLEVKVVSDVNLKAGDKGAFEVSVKNNGDKAVHRVWARSDSDNPFLKNIDFTFGRIEPGEKKSWLAEIKAPKSLISRWDPVKVELRAGEAVLTAEQSNAKAGAVSRALDKPAYAYSYEVSDVNESKPELSGNGVLDIGDRIELALEVTNRGKGTSAATEVNIRGEGAQRILLEAARHRLEEFAPGETRDAPMSFSFEEAADDNTLTVVVNITDSDYNSLLTDTLKFKVGERYVTSSRRVPPTLSFEASPPLRTPDEQISLDVKVADDEEVKELYVYLDGKKVYYGRNSDGDKLLEASFTVDLQEGSNFLTLAATDQNDVLDRKSFFIYKASDVEELALMNALPAEGGAR